MDIIREAKQYQSEQPKKNYDYDNHLLKIRSSLVLLRRNKVETLDLSDKVYWMFTRFIFSVLDEGISLETVRREPIFTDCRKHSFGLVGTNMMLLTVSYKAIQFY